MITIAVANQKGGVGKTSTTAAIGRALANKGLKVLLVDLDPQSSLTISLGLNPKNVNRSVYDLLVRPAEASDPYSILHLKDAFLALLPATIDLSKAEMELYTEFERERVLTRLLRGFPHYDVAVIDCPPSLGLLTVNALAAANHVLIPIQADYLALRGAALLMETIQKVRGGLNPQLNILGLLITMADKRTLHAREIAEQIVKHFGRLVFNVVIPFSVRAKEAPIRGVSVIEYDPSSIVSQAYTAVAEQIFNRIFAPIMEAMTHATTRPLETGVENAVGAPT